MPWRSTIVWRTVLPADPFFLESAGAAAELFMMATEAIPATVKEGERHRIHPDRSPLVAPSTNEGPGKKSR